MTTLFIGVVSHEGSRFAVSQGPEGLARQLESRLGDEGVGVTVKVNTADLHDTGMEPVNSSMVQACLTAQLHLDREWAVFLGRRRDLRWWGGQVLRWMRRVEQTVRRPRPQVVERLLNIELSHLDLMREGIRSKSEWVLILEDDAAAINVTDCSQGLRGLLALEGDQPAYVNVSASFANDELGIGHLLTPVGGGAWAGTLTRAVLRAERPVTNTVCAILYRGSFLSSLVSAMDALPMQPVVPIDWKLNLALMRMFDEGAIRAGDCWLVDPAPIDQLSMRTLR
ncbi:MAG: hypothetical protein K9G24_01655 [Candidatus Nanopelagicales bacterium]|nr:hypothetical protein [Candidatus Nanopelagicales bacterium]MCF8536781.1 hypothetical protein [Candidatus Nanopelagicales bacterium]MCF8541766.1 hypothetical protein [Candidatus Nanopelagicales bacterium]MCF8556193.1 hypothetical protein [Candidatus Nanopelagicales bacterium]